MESKIFSPDAFHAARERSNPRLEYRLVQGFGQSFNDGFSNMRHRSWLKFLYLICFAQRAQELLLFEISYYSNNADLKAFCGRGHLELYCFYANISLIFVEAAVL